MIFLDADVCIDLFRGKQPIVERRLARALTHERRLGLSSITLHEIWVGIAGARSGDEAKLNALRTHVELVEWTGEDAIAAGRVRADLRRRGCKIGDLDILLAGQALVHGAAVATANARHFERVPGLLVENWREPQSA